MDLQAVEKVYRRYAPGYDFYFGALFQPGRRAVLERMACRPGERVLEVGVGTGLSLPLYPRDVQVTGIDISPAMLARAQAKKEGRSLDHVALRRMNAERMSFADDSFDKVVAMYVVSVAPDPKSLVAEMRRVCRPGGELYFLNHFRHANSLVSCVERMAAPLSALLGFHPDYSLEDFLGQTMLEVDEKIPVNLFGYWTLLKSSNSKGGAGTDPARPAGASLYPTPSVRLPSQRSS